MLGGNNNKPIESHSEESDSKTNIDKDEETIFDRRIFKWNRYPPEI